MCPSSNNDKYLPGLSLTSSRNFENALAKSSMNLSPFSNMAAKLPLTILGDIGELARSRLDPKLVFLSRVSVNSKFYIINVTIICIF